MRLICCASLLVFSSMAFATDLKETVLTALETNPEIQAKIKQKGVRTEERESVFSRYLPQVQLAAAVGREYSDNSSTQNRVGGSDTLTRKESSIAAQQLLFDGFEVSSELDREEMLIEAAAYDVMGTSERVAIEAIEAHINIIKAQRVFDFTMENLESHLKIHDQISMRVKSGADNKAKVNQINARLALARANVEAASNNLKDARSEYEKVVSLLPAETPAMPTSVIPLPASLQAFVEEALQQNPEILASQAEVAAARENIQATKGGYYPQLFVETGASWNDNLDGVNGRNDDAFVQLKMKYDLFQGGETRARKRQAVYQMEEVEKVLDSRRREIRRDVEVAWNAKESATKRVAYLKDYQTSSALTKSSYEQQFHIGQRSLLDLLDSENELLRAQTQLTEAQMELLLAKYQILQIKGSLLENLTLATAQD